MLTNVGTYVERPTCDKNKLKSGSWCFEQTNTAAASNAVGVIYIADNPSGYTMELAKKRFAFGTPPTDDHKKAEANVTIKDLAIEKYANLYQMGAIGNQVCGDGWVIDGNEIRLNGTGINAGHKALVRNNYVHRNAQIGLKVSLLYDAEAADALVAGNTIAYNAPAEGGFSAWEGGGTKFANTKNLRVMNNVLHGNRWSGIWQDVENENGLIEDNYVSDTQEGPGIWHEIQMNPSVIRWNTLQNNDNGNIAVQNSQNTKVYNNFVVVADKEEPSILVNDANAHLCKLLQICKDSKEYDPTVFSKNNHVEDNVVFFGGTAGSVGLWHDWGVIETVDGNVEDHLNNPDKKKPD